MFKDLYLQLSELYQCSWLKENYKSDVSYALSIMNEKASIMGVRNLIPANNSKEANSMITRSLQLPGSKAQRRLSIRLDAIDPSSFSLNEINKNTSNLQNLLNVNNNSNNTYNKLKIPDLTPILPTIDESNNYTSDFASKNDLKNDTRIVNEAFQDTLIPLIRSFDAKIQAETYVLVDILYKPATVLCITHQDSFNDSFLSKYFLSLFYSSV